MKSKKERTVAQLEERIKKLEALANKPIVENMGLANTASTTPSFSATFGKLENRLKDMDSRVREIENFRNHPSIERKINSLFEKIDEIEHNIGSLKKQVKELQDEKRAVPA